MNSAQEFVVYRNELHPRQRHHVLLAVCRVMDEVAPGEFTGDERGRSRPGGFRHVNGQLDALIEIVRRTTASQIEPYLAEIQDEICSHCRFQYPSAYCPLRATSNCLLYRCADRIIPAIARALEEIKDEVYVQNHPFPHLTVGGRLPSSSRMDEMFTCT